MKNIELKKRIVDISYKHKLSHIGSCLTALDIIYDIYVKHPNDTFILSSGHAGLALYVVLEKVYGLDAERLFNKHGVHPSRCEEDRIYCSSGSLGHGLGICNGMALKQNNKRFHVLASDGECAEGSIWEALRFINDYPLNNIEVYVNCNGYSAYQAVDIDRLERRLKAFLPRTHIVRTQNEFPDVLNGLDAHYHILTEEEYKKILNRPEIW